MESEGQGELEQQPVIEGTSDAGCMLPSEDGDGGRRGRKVQEQPPTRLSESEVMQNEVPSTEANDRAASQQWSSSAESTGHCFPDTSNASPAPTVMAGHTPGKVSQQQSAYTYETKPAKEGGMPSSSTPAYSGGSATNTPVPKPGGELSVCQGLKATQDAASGGDHQPSIQCTYGPQGQDHRHMESGQVDEGSEDPHHMQGQQMYYLPADGNGAHAGCQQRTDSTKHSSGGKLVKVESSEPIQHSEQYEVPGSTDIAVYSKHQNQEYVVDQHASQIHIQKDYVTGSHYTDLSQVQSQTTDQQYSDSNQTGFAVNRQYSDPTQAGYTTDQQYSGPGYSDPSQAGTTTDLQYSDPGQTGHVVAQQYSEQTRSGYNADQQYGDPNQTSYTSGQLHSDPSPAQLQEGYANQQYNDPSQTGCIVNQQYSNQGQTHSHAGPYDVNQQHDPGQTVYAADQQYADPSQAQTHTGPYAAHQQHNDPGQTMYAADQQYTDPSQVHAHTGPYAAHQQYNDPGQTVYAADQLYANSSQTQSHAGPYAASQHYSHSSQIGYAADHQYADPSQAQSHHTGPYAAHQQYNDPGQAVYAADQQYVDPSQAQSHTGPYTANQQYSDPSQIVYAADQQYVDQGQAQSHTGPYAANQQYGDPSQSEYAADQQYADSSQAQSHTGPYAANQQYGDPSQSEYAADQQYADPSQAQSHTGPYAANQPYSDPSQSEYATDQRYADPSQAVYDTTQHYGNPGHTEYAADQQYVDASQVQPHTAANQQFSDPGQAGYAADQQYANPGYATTQQYADPSQAGYTAAQQHSDPSQVQPQASFTTSQYKHHGPLQLADGGYAAVCSSDMYPHNQYPTVLHQNERSHYRGYSDDSGTSQHGKQSQQRLAASGVTHEARESHTPHGYGGDSHSSRQHVQEQGQYGGEPHKVELAHHIQRQDQSHNPYSPHVADSRPYTADQGYYDGTRYPGGDSHPYRYQHMTDTSGANQDPGYQFQYYRTNDPQPPAPWHPDSPGFEHYSPRSQQESPAPYVEPSSNHQHGYHYHHYQHSTVRGMPYPTRPPGQREAYSRERRPFHGSTMYRDSSSRPWRGRGDTRHPYRQGREPFKHKRPGIGSSRSDSPTLGQSSPAGSSSPSVGSHTNSPTYGSPSQQDLTRSPRDDATIHSEANTDPSCRSFSRKLSDPRQGAHQADCEERHYSKSHKYAGFSSTTVQRRPAMLKYSAVKRSVPGKPRGPPLIQPHHASSADDKDKTDRAKSDKGTAMKGASLTSPLAGFKIPKNKANSQSGEKGTSSPTKVPMNPPPRIPKSESTADTTSHPSEKSRSEPAVSQAATVPLRDKHTLVPVAAQKSKSRSDKQTTVDARSNRPSTVHKPTRVTSILAALDPKALHALAASIQQTLANTGTTPEKTACTLQDGASAEKVSEAETKVSVSTSTAAPVPPQSVPVVIPSVSNALQSKPLQPASWKNTDATMAKPVVASTEVVCSSLDKGVGTEKMKDDLKQLGVYKQEMPSTVAKPRKKLAIPLPTQPSRAVVAQVLEEQKQPTRASHATSIEVAASSEEVTNSRSVQAVPSNSGDSHMPVQPTQVETQASPVTLSGSHHTPIDKCGDGEPEVTSERSEEQLMNIDNVPAVSGVTSEGIPLEYFDPKYMFKEYNLRKAKKSSATAASPEQPSPKKRKVESEKEQRIPLSTKQETSSGRQTALPSVETMPAAKRLKASIESEGSTTVKQSVSRTMTPLLRSPPRSLESIVTELKVQASSKMTEVADIPNHSLESSAKPLVLTTQLEESKQQEPCDQTQANKLASIVRRKSSPVKRSQKGIVISHQKGRTLAAQTTKCSLCGCGANVSGLGFLYGPYTFRQNPLPHSADSTGTLLRSGSSAMWVHEDCTAWAPGVCLVGNKLVGLEEAINDARDMTCIQCKKSGATLCCKTRGCKAVYHYPCALEAGCEFVDEQFTVSCAKHKEAR